MTILSSNKLTGENYVDWKRNLDIILTVDKHKFVLTTPCPPEPVEGSTEDEKTEYQTWLRSDEVARCYILASISNVLQQQHQAYETAADMVFNLAEMFGHQGRQARRLAVKSFMNCRMKPGTSVRDHMLVIMGHLNEMEILGAEIDGETQVDMILESLPTSFDNFKLNYSMNKFKYSLTELMKELQVAEGIQGKRKEMDTNFVSNKASISAMKSSRGTTTRGRTSQPRTSQMLRSVLTRLRLLVTTAAVRAIAREAAAFILIP